MTSSFSNSTADFSGIKRRVSKACDACRKSKTKCDGERPCSRCLKENKLCTYSNSNIGYAEAKCKKLYNQEYVDLLETRNSLLTKALGYLFKRFDKCVDSGLVQVNPERLPEFRQLLMQSQSSSLSQTSDTGDTNASDYSSWNQEGSNENLVPPAQNSPAVAWMNLKNNKNLFINKETGKLNVNEVVYSIIPTNVDMAVKSLNYIHGNSDQISRVNSAGISDGKECFQNSDRLLPQEYVNSRTLFTSDHSKEGIPEDSNIGLSKRKRQKALPHGDPSEVGNHNIQQQGSTVQILPVQPAADTVTIKQDTGSHALLNYNPNGRIMPRNGNLSFDHVANHMAHSNQPQQWYPKLEYSQFDMLDSFNSEFKRHHQQNNVASQHILSSLHNNAHTANFNHPQIDRNQNHIDIGGESTNTNSEYDNNSGSYNRSYGTNVIHPESGYPGQRM